MIRLYGGGIIITSAAIGGLAGFWYGLLFLGITTALTGAVVGWIRFLEGPP